MAKAGAKDPLLETMREICLSLPDTKETPTWGQPHFRVGEKIFAGYGAQGDKAEISFKLEMEHQAEVIKDPRFYPAPYVGSKGWVATDPRTVTDWEDIRRMVHESYRLIAPKKSLAKLAGGAGAAKKRPQPKPTRAAKKSPAKATAAKRKAAVRATAQRARSSRK